MVSCSGSINISFTYPRWYSCFYNFFSIISICSTVVLEKVLMKSVIGYGLAAIVAYIVWLTVSYFINEKFDKVKKNHRQAWVIGQWFTTGFLWYTWLSHDVANIAVFLPRQLSVILLIVSIVLTKCITFLHLLGYTGGRIQKVVYSKTRNDVIQDQQLSLILFTLLFYLF